MTGGTAQRAEDTDESRRATACGNPSEVVLPLTSDAAAASLAAALVTRYAEPLLEVRSLEIRPAVDPATLYPLVLGLDLGSALTHQLAVCGHRGRVHRRGHPA